MMDRRDKSDILTVIRDDLAQLRHLTPEALVEDLRWLLARLEALEAEVMYLSERCVSLQDQYDHAIELLTVSRQRTKMLEQNEAAIKATLDIVGGQIVAIKSRRVEP